MRALRHTMASRLAEDGASATEIQHILGHESLNTSQVYIDATANGQRAAVRANRTYRALAEITKRASAPGSGHSRHSDLKRYPALMHEVRVDDRSSAVTRRTVVGDEGYCPRIG